MTFVLPSFPGTTNSVFRRTSVSEMTLSMVAEAYPADLGRTSWDRGLTSSRNLVPIPVTMRWFDSERTIRPLPFLA